MRSAGCNRLPRPGKGWGAARQHSPAPSSQMPLASLALLPWPPLAPSLGSPPFGQGWGKPPANSSLARSSTPLPGAACTGTWDVKCNRGSGRGGLLKGWALSAVPALANEGDGSRKPARASLCFIITLVLLQPRQGAALPSTSSPRTPTSTQVPHRLRGTEGIPPAGGK